MINLVVTTHLTAAFPRSIYVSMSRAGSGMLQHNCMSYLGENLFPNPMCCVLQPRWKRGKPVQKSDEPSALWMSYNRCPTRHSAGIPVRAPRSVGSAAPLERRRACSVWELHSLRSKVQSRVGSRSIRCACCSSDRLCGFLQLKTNPQFLYLLPKVPFQK